MSIDLRTLSKGQRVVCRGGASGEYWGIDPTEDENSNNRYVVIFTHDPDGGEITPDMECYGSDGHYYNNEESSFDIVGLEAVTVFVNVGLDIVFGEIRTWPDGSPTPNDIDPASIKRVQLKRST